MEGLDDNGKVWLRGKVKPILAVRLGKTIIVPGFEEENKISCWVKDGNLCVDVNDSPGGVRIARQFVGDLEGEAPGTLFSGFNNTKHADILAVLPDSPGVRERRFEGPLFEAVSGMNREEFWKYADF